MGWESGTKACGEWENPNGAAGESGSQEKASFLLWQREGETSQKTGCSRPRAPVWTEGERGPRKLPFPQWDLVPRYFGEESNV